jgi:hypothetical protein
MNDPVGPRGGTGDGVATVVFLEFCNKLRNNDPTILPKPGEPFRIRNLSENEEQWKSLMLSWKIPMSHS